MPSAARDSLRQVAIGLIVVGALNLALGVLACCGRVARLGQDAPVSSSTDDAAALGQLTYVVLALISVPVGAVVLTAGILLLQGKARTFGVVGAIAALIPLSCCFVAGIPVGIWTLMTLNRPDVKALFGGTPPPAGPPPGAWPGGPPGSPPPGSPPPGW